MGSYLNPNPKSFQESLNSKIYNERYFYKNGSPVCDLDR